MSCEHIYHMKYLCNKFINFEYLWLMRSEQDNKGKLVNNVL